MVSKSLLKSEESGANGKKVKYFTSTLIKARTFQFDITKKSRVFYSQSASWSPS
jgi:hypothetical protein